MKLLSCVVAPLKDAEHEIDDEEIHDYTYGITSDPLTQVAVVLSSLIHDVDRRGVPNSALAKEAPQLADVYRGKSITEQNSIDIAWDALMEPQNTDPRRIIYSTRDELMRFQLLIVNSGLATDISDESLALLRKRWDKAFGVAHGNPTMTSIPRIRCRD